MSGEYFADAAARQLAAATKNERTAFRYDAAGLPDLARLYRHTAAQHRAAAVEIERIARERRES